MFVWLKNRDNNRVYKVICGSDEVGDSMNNQVEEVRSLNTIVSEGAAKFVQVYSGGKITLVSQTIDVWTGTDKRSVEVQLNFVAQSDAAKEVYWPIREIQRWASPRGGSRSKDLDIQGQKVATFNLQPPARVWLKIGEKVEGSPVPLVEIRKGIITTCTPTWKPPFDKGGYPIHAELQLTINDIDIQDGNEIYPEGMEFSKDPGQIHRLGDMFSANVTAGRKSKHASLDFEKIANSTVRKYAMANARRLRRSVTLDIFER